MPWLAPSEDAPDTHKLWADPGTPYERALHASGWRHEVAAPGSGEQDQGDEPEVEPTVDTPREVSPETAALVASAKPRRTRK